jgi:hypothetical protein
MSASPPQSALSLPAPTYLLLLPHFHHSLVLVYLCFARLLSPLLQPELVFTIAVIELSCIVALFCSCFASAACSRYILLFIYAWDTR